jgi:hypothetical protein
MMFAALHVPAWGWLPSFAEAVALIKLCGPSVAVAECQYQHQGGLLYCLMRNCPSSNGRGHFA